MDITAPRLPFPADAGRVVSVGNLLSALRRSAWLILLLGLLAGALSLFAARLLPRSYSATGIVAVEAERFAIPELQGAVSGDISLDPLPRVRSEVLVLRSPSLIRAVSDELRLWQHPQFNPELRPPGPLSEAKRFLREHAPWLFSHPARADEEAARQAAAAEALRRLAVTHDNRTFVIGVSFVTEDPVLSASFVNTLVRRYIETRAQARTATNREANATLTRRVEEVRSEVQALDDRVRELRTRNNLVATRALSVGQQRLEELTAAATRATIERAEAEADGQRVASLAKRGAYGELADVLSSQTMARLRDQEGMAARRLAEMSTALGPRHPDRRSAELELSAARRQVAEEAGRVAASIEAQLGVKREKEAAARQQLQDAIEAANTAGRVQADLAQLEREADARRNLYQTLLERAEQTAVDPRGMNQEPSARVVSLASVPTKPSGAQPSLVGAIGAIVGVFAGGFVAVLRGRSPVGFATAQELTDATGLPVVATLPRAFGRRRRTPLAAGVRSRPAGGEAEALRALRGRLRAVRGGAAPRSVLFMAAGEEVDAPGLAAAFATVAALDGERVLLVEGDARRAGLARGFGDAPGAAAPAKRLSSVLKGALPWRDAVAADPQSPLHLLLAEPNPDFAPSVPVSMRMQSALGEMAQEYNLVVVGGPPAAAASEALALARGVDAALLVVGAKGARRSAVRDAAAQLAPASSGPVAAVFLR